MKMKYFRFLYGETGGCFMHLGEIRDTKTGEYFTFLYLREGKEHVNRAEADHTLFLCPKTLNLVVLGKTDERTEEAVKTLLADREVDTLVYSAGEDCRMPDLMPGVKRVIRLKEKAADDAETVNPSREQDGRISEDIQESIIYQTEIAGWSFLARSYEEGTVMLFHGLASETEKASVRHYDDCVMSVKVVNGEERCGKEQKPDGYGCALGCPLHRDYDVCKYRRAGEAPYVTGTVLLPEVSGNDGWKRMMKALQPKLPEIRFFGLPGITGAAIREDILSRISEISAYKRYFIGADSELEDEAVAAVSRSSQYHIPAVLKSGEAICCSGLLKYSE